MKEIKSTGSMPVLAVAALCLLMAGCVARRVAWSPDGTHAAVFAGDGLRLCGPDGALSETILPGEGLAEWFADSHRLAVMSETGKQSWQDLQKVLSPEERQRVVQGGKTVLDEFKAGRGLAEAFKALTGLGDHEKDAVGVYLAEGGATKEQAGTNWEALQQQEASVVQIRVGMLAGGKLTLGPPLLNSLRKILDMRVSPAGTAIAFTAEGDKKTSYNFGSFRRTAPRRPSWWRKTRPIVPIGQPTAMPWCMSAPSRGLPATIRFAWPRSRGAASSTPPARSKFKPMPRIWPACSLMPTTKCAV